jgi:hypothetical protein
MWCVRGRLVKPFWRPTHPELARVGTRQGCVAEGKNLGVPRMCRALVRAPLLNADAFGETETPARAEGWPAVIFRLPQRSVPSMPRIPTPLIGSCQPLEQHSLPKKEHQFSCRRKLTVLHAYLSGDNR